MPKQIVLSDQTIAGLKRHAEPLDDTYDSVVARLIDFFESHRSTTSEVTSVPPITRASLPPPEEFNPYSPPNLRHTKVTTARVAGMPLPNPSWNGLLDEVLRRSFPVFGGFQALDSVASVKMVAGRKTDEGYHYIQEFDFSVQGQDANDAWKCAALLASMVQCPVEVQFVWRTKEGAAFPGTSGRFAIGGEP